MKTALIIGITGQDGSYLTEHLLNLGYAVHGLVRRSSMFNRDRIEHLRSAGASATDRLALHYSELNDHTSIRRLLHRIRPDEIYYLAGQSHVGLSFEIPEVTCHENGMAILGLLESLRDLDYPARFYHASSSEIFGTPLTSPQNEQTPCNPVNPYGCAKAFATQLCRVYRQSYGIFACNGIAYNHESPRRGENFVTRKITMGAARIAAGQQADLVLGNLDACRDWGWAPEYVEAMWRALQAKEADDFILATGKVCSVRAFATAAFAQVGIQLVFSGRNTDEIARRADTDAVVLRVDPRYYRPVDSAALVGDARLAQSKLSWTARTAGVDVARAMAQHDRQILVQPVA